MSKLKVFSVYDSKVGAYHKPFFLQSAGVAIRSFIDAVNDPEIPFAKHPGDYTLFELGSYDEYTGRFENLLAPINLGTALEHQSRSLQAIPGGTDSAGGTLGGTSNGTKDPGMAAAIDRVKRAVESHGHANQ